MTKPLDTNWRDRKRSTPYMTLNDNSWFSRTSSLSMAQRGFLITLCFRLWKYRDELPDDQTELASLLVCNPRTVAKHLPELIALDLIARRGGKIIPGRNFPEIGGKP